jgi:methylphosphotriester-DNA--protein-cysteine methyltransferase
MSATPRVPVCTVAPGVSAGRGRSDQYSCDVSGGRPPVVGAMAPSTGLQFCPHARVARQSLSWRATAPWHGCTAAKRSRAASAAAECHGSGAVRVAKELLHQHEQPHRDQHIAHAGGQTWRQQREAIEASMRMMRKRCTPAFKTQVVQEALTDERTLAQIAAPHGGHPNLITRWKQAPGAAQRLHREPAPPAAGNALCGPVDWHQSRVPYRD